MAGGARPPRGPVGGALSAGDAVVAFTASATEGLDSTGGVGALSAGAVGAGIVSWTGGLLIGRSPTGSSDVALGPVGVAR